MDDSLGSSIGDVAWQCRAALQQCVAIPVLMELEWAENRLAEFKMWAQTTGAFAGEKASLDARLALEPDVQNLVMSMLILLHGCVERCEKLSQTTSHEDSTAGRHGDEATPAAGVTPGESQDSSEEEDYQNAQDGNSKTLSPTEEIPRGFSPWEDDSSYDSEGEEEGEAEEQDSTAEDVSNGHFIQQDTPLDVSKKEVDQIIDHLTRLALAIRKSGSTSRLHKADKLYKQEMHQRLRQHLEIVVLAEGTEDGSLGLSVNPSFLTPVQERLIDANLRRRNRFMYAQRHARKLAQEASSSERRQFALGDTDDPVAIPDADDVSQVSGEDDYRREQKQAAGDKPSAPAGGRHDNGLEAPVPRTEILTATSASAMDRPVEPVPRLPATASQAAKTHITTTAAKIKYPKPPQPREGQRYFQCPCCAQALPEMFRETTMWKKHLMTDICPYTCIAEDCPKPTVLYVTHNEWRRHVERDHQQCWDCPPCRQPGAAPVVFPSLKKFIDHLNNSHSDTITEDQHSTIAQEASRPVPLGISSCPLCDSEGPSDSVPLLEHIAEHVHAFSLRSLPWAGDDWKDAADKPEKGDPEREYQSYFNDANYFDQASDGQSQNDAFTDSDRDISDLASLSSHESPENETAEGSGLEGGDGEDFDNSGPGDLFRSDLGTNHLPEAVFPDQLAVPLPLSPEVERAVLRRSAIWSGLLRKIRDTEQVSARQQWPRYESKYRLPADWSLETVDGDIAELGLEPPAPPPPANRFQSYRHEEEPSTEPYGPHVSYSTPVHGYRERGPVHEPISVNLGGSTVATPWTDQALQRHGLPGGAQVAPVPAEKPSRVRRLINRFQSAVNLPGSSDRSQDVGVRTPPPRPMRWPDEANAFEDVPPGVGGEMHLEVPDRGAINRNQRRMLDDYYAAHARGE